MTDMLGEKRPQSCAIFQTAVKAEVKTVPTDDRHLAGRGKEHREEDERSVEKVFVVDIVSLKST